jgi:type II secretory pathway pseudopilin PulG
MKSAKVKLINHVRGFTLVEALVAISILMIAIASPMTLAQKGLSTATLSKDQMIASFLAQDAIEAVKNIRDQIAVSLPQGNDWLAGNGTEFLAPCICKEGDNCNFDVSPFIFCTIDTTGAWTSDSNSIKLGNSLDDAKLKISYTAPRPDGTKQFLKYDYTSNGETSKFSRYINIKKTSASGIGADEAVVDVRVSWDTPQGVQKIDIQNFIYNYSENL